jgi:hypothetical protein
MLSKIARCIITAARSVLENRRSMVDEAGVIHDAAALYRFVDTIRTTCDLGRGYPAYSDASREFLIFIGQLADATKEYVSRFPSKMPSKFAEYPVYRQELLTLRDAWYEVHRRVKPIVDADTLHVPSALISSLVRRLRTVPRFQNTRLAILHTELLNYLQVVGSRIRGTATSISALVGAPPFPPNLGLIGIPYSQCESVFLNCLIAHEIGHFVFGELSLKNTLGTKARAILDTVFAPISASLKPAEGWRITSLFAEWTEELFCDLFAVRLLGPCYTYAFVEIFDFPNLLLHDGSFNKNAAALSLVFSGSHPADLYRVNKQVGLLRSLGWWDEIKDSHSTVKKVLENSVALTVAAFSIPSFGHVQMQMLDALDRVTSEITIAVENSLAGLDSGVTEYAHLKNIVGKYLHHGVVPSIVPDPTSGLRKSPNVVTILNVAYQVYLDSLPELMRRIEDQDPSSVVARTAWTERLESWTLKALDDLELISMQPTA